ncbi:inosine/guanosine kinase [Bacteriovorax sp. Seq25_V]|uniref:inosine/guanosine kinase n=1 Tax=Bacteriovorax sp. Seq25_V TaxID=1201288 RepID=UPI00038A4354|nr:inosine/guanosine kinase [Bacteriovorax sp. Seq25_V]EQC46339.1 carbohydrate kinase, PfkB family [Bacteriovorax sp. Seq25_V]
MKFPGKRKSKHYFPVEELGRVPFENNLMSEKSVYITGIDQLLVDIEIDVTDDILEKYNVTKGQSQVLSDEIVESIYRECKDKNLILGEFAGGAVGNTLHNYSTLSDDRSVALGTICENIKVGDYAFKYICTTSSKVDFNHLQPVKGAMARAMCFVTPDKERTFAIGKGIMNELDESYIPEDVIRNSASLLVTAFLLRDEKSPLFKATMKAVKVANEANVPVVFALGTSFLIEEKRDFFLDFISKHVNVVATNLDEAKALSHHDDPLLAGEFILNLADLVLLTVGARGLYVCAWVDEKNARETKDHLHSKSLVDYNAFEYSRAQLKSDCEKPIKIYTHINPFMGGPVRIENTNGAGDAALSALLHDISANNYHRQCVPNSPKHNANYLTYSSIHQISKYANRVSYEVLKQRSPRLAHGLPMKEESLDESYWEL